jgi:hypothetical protein
MKKIFLILSVVAGFVACSSDGLRENAAQENTPLTEQYDPNRRSFAEAVQIARNSINMLEEDKAVTRGIAPARKLNLKDGVKAFRKAGTRSDEANSDNDTLLYVFNFEDNQGFSIVSASRHAEGLIAVVEEGSYDPAVPTGNPGFDTYMNMAKAYVAYKDKEGSEKETLLTKATTRQNPMYNHVYDTVYYQNIAPKITVCWGQEYRMGQYCPNYISGCAATAAAQIMSYYQYPSGRTLTYSGADVSYTSFSWSYMCNSDHKYANHTSNVDVYDKQIGRLARQLGQESGASYNTNDTSISPSDIRNTIISWGYNAGNITSYNYSNIDNTYVIGNMLGNGRLAYMYGYNSDGNGHGWVVDGCKYVKTLERVMISYDGINWSVFQEIATYRTCLNHINWGCNGAGNGYFLSQVLNAYSAIQSDLNDYTLENGHNYNYYIDVNYFSVWH